MTHPHPSKHLVRAPSHWFLRPPAVLICIVVGAVCASAHDPHVTTAILVALAVLVGGIAVVALAGAVPLRPWSERSHLTLRLSWLGRYGIAAFLLGVSTFLGGVAGSHALTDTDPERATELLVGLVGEVARHATIWGLLIFAAWLVVDLIRLGPHGRAAGVERTLRWLMPPRPARFIHHPAVRAWVLVLSHPTAGGICISLGVGYLVGPLAFP